VERYQVHTQIPSILPLQIKQLDMHMLLLFLTCKASESEEHGNISKVKELLMTYNFQAHPNPC
jgi:hypothetical protein